MTSHVFPDPSHDHQHCAAEILASAEKRCRQYNARLTEHRKQVLSILAAVHQPLGAYEILERFKLVDDKRPAPAIIYRALDFLMAHGLVHKIERLNAFTACTHAGVDHHVQFLICTQCQAVAEIANSSIDNALIAGAKSVGFSITSPIVEIEGLCPNCQSKDQS